MRVVRAGESYHYDLDGTVVAQGSRPLIWSLGKKIDGQMTNVPIGMSIDPRTGALSWVPSDNQEGKHWVTVMVSNDAGMDVQEFEVNVGGAASSSDVDNNTTVRSACGCESNSAASGNSAASERTAAGGMLLLVAAVAAICRRVFA